MNDCEGWLIFSVACNCVLAVVAIILAGLHGEANGQLMEIKNRELRKEAAEEATP